MTDELKRNVNFLLAGSGLRREEGEQPVRLLLYHLLMTLSLHDRMSAGERDEVKKLYKRFRNLFSSKVVLKERKERAEKKSLPPHPLLKEKGAQRKVKENTHTVCDADSGFDEDLLERLEVFQKKCERYVGKYGRAMVDDFIRYWTLPNQTTGRMRFEETPYWRLSSMLESWHSKSFTKNDAAADLRLQKARSKQQKEQTGVEARQAEAAERERANAELERQIAERKAGAVSREEWLAMRAAKATEAAKSAEGGVP